MIEIHTAFVNDKTFANVGYKLKSYISDEEGN